MAAELCKCFTQVRTAAHSLALCQQRPSGGQRTAVNTPPPGAHHRPGPAPGHPGAKPLSFPTSLQRRFRQGPRVKPRELPKLAPVSTVRREPRLDSPVNTGTSTNAHLSITTAGQAVSRDSSPPRAPDQEGHPRRSPQASGHQWRRSLAAGTPKAPPIQQDHPRSASSCLGWDHWGPDCRSKCGITSTVPATATGPVGPHVAGGATGVPSGSPLAGPLSIFPPANLFSSSNSSQSQPLVKEAPDGRGLPLCSSFPKGPGSPACGQCSPAPQPEPSARRPASWLEHSQVL